VRSARAAIGGEVKQRADGPSRAHWWRDRGDDAGQRTPRPPTDARQPESHAGHGRLIVQRVNRGVGVGQAAARLVLRRQQLVASNGGARHAEREVERDSEQHNGQDTPARRPRETAPACGLCGAPKVSRAVQ